MELDNNELQFKEFWKISKNMKIIAVNEVFWSSRHMFLVMVIFKAKLNMEPDMEICYMLCWLILRLFVWFKICVL